MAGTLKRWTGTAWEVVGGSGGGVKARGKWSSATTYAKGDLVYYKGFSFVSNLDANLNKDPLAPPTYTSVASNPGPGGVTINNPNHGHLWMQIRPSEALTFSRLTMTLVANTTYTIGLSGGVSGSMTTDAAGVGSMTFPQITWGALTSGYHEIHIQGSTEAAISGIPHGATENTTPNISFTDVRRYADKSGIQGGTIIWALQTSNVADDPWTEIATPPLLQDEGADQPLRGTLNFVGTGVAVTDDATNDKSVITINSGGGGHAIQDEGVALTARPTLNFVGAGVSVADDATGGKTVVTVAGGGAGSSPYTKQTNLTEPADALTAWTAASGTWGAAGGIFSQTAHTAARNLLRRNAQFKTDPSIYSTRIRFPSAGQNAGDLYGGLLLSDTGSGTDGFLLRMQRVGGAWSLQWERDAFVAIGNVAITAALDTWYVLKMVREGSLVTGFIDNVKIGAFTVAAPNAGDVPHLYTYSASVDFDDISHWTVALDHTL